MTRAQSLADIEEIRSDPVQINRIIVIQSLFHRKKAIKVAELKRRHKVWYGSFNYVNNAEDTEGDLGLSNDDTIDKVFRNSFSPEVQDLFFVIVWMIVVFVFVNVLFISYAAVDRAVNKDKTRWQLPLAGPILLLDLEDGYMWIHALILNVNKGTIDDKMKQSLVWEILVQPVVLYLIYAFFKYATVWLSCNRTCSIKKNLGGKRDGPRWYLCCGGAKRRGGWCCGPCLQRCLKGHEIEMSDLKKEMQHERLNVTLNIFEEDTNDEIADHNKEHKLHMRTINEGPLLGDNGCFGGKWDNLIFHILLRGDLKMWNRDKRKGPVNKYAPFLQTSPLREEFYNNAKFDGARIVKQMRDQIVNRLSMLFGSAFIAQDQGLHYVSEKYIFGITYEENDVKIGTTKKCRVLVMQEKSLRRMKQLWDEDIQNDRITFHFKDNYYAQTRTRALITMIELYDASQRHTFRNSASAMSMVVGQAQDHNELSDRPLIGEMFIAASGPTVTSTAQD